jgi:hypothetical protein
MQREKHKERQQLVGHQRCVLWSPKRGGGGYHQAATVTAAEVRLDSKTPVLHARKPKEYIYIYNLRCACVMLKKKHASHLLPLLTISSAGTSHCCRSSRGIDSSCERKNRKGYIRWMYSPTHAMHCGGKREGGERRRGCTIK